MTVRAVLFGALLVTPLLGGLAFAFWPGPGWHSGPISRDLDAELAPQGLAAATSFDAAAIEAETQPATVARNLHVARGDTLMGILVKAGVARQEAHQAITALRDVFSPRDLKPGQEIRLGLAAAPEDGKGGRLLALGLQPSVEREVRVHWADKAGFIAEAVERPLLRRNVSVAGTIETNLSVAAREAGLPMAMLTELIRMYSFDVDFQRELQPGDGFEVLYEGMFETDGRLAKANDIVYAALTLSGQRLDLYSFTPKSGRSDFFDPKGQSVRKTLMRTPIDGARLSSGFGKRRHPILGYTKMHRGTDFAAPRGTPIYAAGDGVIETAGRNGGYGKYVRIRHNSTYKTAYAHMSRIAKGVRRGKRVKQGQVIGYVGSTGRSTGPHLHYEVMVGGRQVNPLKVKLPSGEKLKGEDLEAFAVARAEIDALRNQALGNTLMVNAECKDAQPSDGGLAPASGC